MRRDEELLLEIDSKVTALAERLGYKMVKDKCANSVCKYGRWPDGGACADCGGLGYIFNAEEVK